VYLSFQVERGGVFESSVLQASLKAFVCKCLNMS
jgi:hypothetical protein